MKITIPTHSKEKWLKTLLSASPEPLLIEEGKYISSAKLDKRIASFLLGSERCLFNIKNIKGEEDLIVKIIRRKEKVKIISKSTGIELKASPPGRRGFGFIDRTYESNSHEAHRLLSYINSKEPGTIKKLSALIVIEEDFFLPEDLETYD